MERAKRNGTITRRRLVTGAAGLSALALAGACAPGAPGQGGAGGGAQPGASTAPARFMWQIREGPTYRSLAEWGVAQFKQKYPNVTVDLSSDTTGNFEKTVALMVSDTGPDIFHGWGQLLQAYAGKGVMYNHNDLLKAERSFPTDDFIDYQWKGFVVPSTNFRFGLPTYVNLFVLYYNKSLVQRRGQKEPTADLTHEAYADWLRQLTFTENEKKTWGGFQNTTVFDRQYHAWAFGGNYVDPRDLTKSLMGDEKTVQAMEWQRARLFQDQSWAPVDAAKRPWQPNSQFDGLFQGVLASVEDGMHAFDRVARGMQTAGSEWGIMHLPKGPVKRASLGTTDGWALWKGTKAKDSAWELMKYLTTPEWYARQIEIEGLLPSRKSSLETWVTSMKGKWPEARGVDYKVVTDALTTLNYPQPDLAFLCQAEASQVLTPALNAVLRDGERPATYFRDIKGQIEQAASVCGFKFQ
jgi:multiple sugar transport system substrate-binding protein